MASRFSVEGVFRAKDKLSGIFAQVESRASRLARNASRNFGALDRANTTLIGGLTKTAAVVSVAGVAASGALALIAGSSNKVEDGLAKLATVTTPLGKTMAQALEESKNAALDWSKAHAQSAEQFLDANYNMGSAGLNSVQALEGTRTALLLATATMGDAATASNLVATLYNNMADRSADASREMTRLGDVLAKTQALFQIKDLGQLNESLKMGTPAALQFGVSVEQLSNALGFLNTAGLQGSMAGTAFSATMRQMGKASKSLRFEVAKTADGGVDFAGTITNIEKKFGSFAKMTDEQKAKFQQAFGDEGLRGISLMLGKSEELRGSLTKIGSAAGTMVEQAATIEGTRSKGWDKLANRIEAVRVRLGDALLPVIDRVMPSVDRAIDGVERWTQANGRWLQGGFADAVATARSFVGGLAEGFGTARAAMDGALAPLREVTGLFGESADNAKLLEQAVGIAGPAFLGYTIAVKGVRVAVVAYEAAAFIASGTTAAWTFVTGGAASALGGLRLAAYASAGATWAKHAALTAARVATTRYSAATLIAEGRAWAARGAQIAYTGAVHGGRAAVQLYTTWVNRERFATMASTGWTWLRRGAQIAYNGAMVTARGVTDAYAMARGRATAAERLGAASAGAANLALGPLLLTLGAVTLAVGSLIAAWKQWEGLDKAAGGHAWEGVKAAFDFEKGGSMGERFFKAVDEGMNADARRKFAEEQAAKGAPAPQIVSPQDRVASSINETRTESVDKTEAEITIKDKTGGRAQVTKPGKVPIKMKPSGAFG